LLRFYAVALESHSTFTRICVLMDSSLRGPIEARIGYREG